MLLTYLTTGTSAIIRLFYVDSAHFHFFFQKQILKFTLHKDATIQPMHCVADGGNIGISIEICYFAGSNQDILICAGKLATFQLDLLMFCVSNSK